jgi:hypothetical protein
MSEKKEIITVITLPDIYYKILKSSPTLWERIRAMRYQTWVSHGFFTPGPIAEILTFNRIGNNCFGHHLKMIRHHLKNKI